MEQFLNLLGLTFWAVILFRALAFRATLSWRTLAVYILCGTLIAAVVSSLLYWLVAPYGVHWPFQSYLIQAAHQLLLALPVLFVFLYAGACRVTSVGDVFLAGFSVGLGYDAAGAALLALHGTVVADVLSWLPPFIFAGEQSTIAGHAYWTGLVCIVPAALLRFAGGRWLIAVTGALLAFGWVTLEGTALLYGAAEGSLVDGFARATLRGQLTPWLTLAILLGLSALELWWLKSAGAVEATFQETVREMARPVSFLVKGRPKTFVGMLRLVALRRQAMIAQAEANARPAGDRFHETAKRVVAELERALARRRYGPDLSRANDSGAWKAWVGSALLWIALLILISPSFLLSFRTWFWQLEWLHLVLGGFPGLLNSLLIVALAWHYLSASGRPKPAPDDFVCFAGERMILASVLVVVPMILVYGSTQSLYPFISWPAKVTQAGLPQYPAEQQHTLLLLYVCALTGVTMVRAASWRVSAPIELRRATALRNAMTFLSVLLVFWFCFTVYPSGVRLYHARYGPQLYQEAFRASGSNAQETTWLGNFAAARAVTLLTGLTGTGLYLLLQFGSRRLRKFMGME